jgi:hypothetical protein
MKGIFLRNLAVVAALTTLVIVTGTLPAHTAVKKAASKKVAKTTAVEPAAIAALDKMGAYLRTLNMLHVEAVTQREEVLDNGLKVQFAETTTLLARKPDRLLVKVTSDRKEREFFYNGKKFTLWGPRVKFYATVEAPPTIGKLLDTLQSKYTIEMPFFDLFRWGATPASKSGITVAMDIGPSKIGDYSCEQYVFRQNGLDWQIWIQKGDSPLPCKIVLTTTTDSARPQFQAIYTWDMAPTINDADFTFNPPADAQRIVFDNGVSNKEK